MVNRDLMIGTRIMFRGVSICLDVDHWHGKEGGPRVPGKKT